MLIIFGITALIILLYLIYPLWLMLFSSWRTANEIETAEIDGVSLIFLSFNGKKYLNDKIKFLIGELSVFKHYELIVIDDYSTDGSKEILYNFRNLKNLQIILKKEHKGIPHSMNIGIENAKYNNVFFCDQRQKLSDNIIQRIVESLKYKNIGAVSACISSLNKENRYSIIRKFENFIKSKESKTGSLIGVYGPLYAIKKNCYATIPEYIILDDLYLSLKIIKSKQIIIFEDCQIIDEDFSILYNYARTKRYLYGFLQIIKEKELVSRLSINHLVMLIWHKYLRLIIPLFLFLSYICIGISGIMNIQYFILFCILTALCLASVFPCIFKIQFWLKNIIRINFFYFLAMLDIIFIDLILKRILTCIIHKFF